MALHYYFGNKVVMEVFWGKVTVPIVRISLQMSVWQQTYWTGTNLMGTTQPNEADFLKELLNKDAVTEGSRDFTVL